MYCDPASHDSSINMVLTDKSFYTKWLKNLQNLRREAILQPSARPYDNNHPTLQSAADRELMQNIFKQQMRLPGPLPQQIKKKKLPCVSLPLKTADTVCTVFSTTHSGPCFGKGSLVPCFTKIRPADSGWDKTTGVHF